VDGSGIHTVKRHDDWIGMRFFEDVDGRLVEYLNCCQCDDCFVKGRKGKGRRGEA
jgi:hypothetical protein